MSIDTTGFAFAKPSGQKQSPRPGLVPIGNERIVCEKNAEGRMIYKRLTWLMWRRQNYCCCICCMPMMFEDASFEHEEPRGMGAAFRQDAIYIRVDGRLQRINGCSHVSCNSQRGSRRTKLFQPDYRKSLVLSVVSNYTAITQWPEHIREVFRKLTGKQTRAGGYDVV